MVCSDDTEAGARRMPDDFLHGPFGLGESFCFTGGESQEPESRVLVFFVDNTSVCFVFLFLLLGFGLGLGCDESDLLAVRRPGELADAALAFGDGGGFAAVGGHQVDLLMFTLAVGDKGELFAVG